MRFLLVLLASLASAATLEQYFSAPFASALTAAPVPGKVAWILDERGARNIWIAEAPGWKGRRLTSFKDDDGMDLGQLTWSADGNTLIFVRGGDLEHLNSALPNPLNLPRTPEQAIWAIPASGDAPRKLAEGHSPAVSKSGRVAFLRGGQIWMTTLEGEKAVSTVQARGSGSLEWSPDGSVLAFVSSRADHSFIGLYRAGEQSLKYIDPSTDRDSNPTWSPDGQRLAYIRQPAGGGRGGANREAREPWSIRVADPKTGTAKEVWRAEPGPGSVLRGIVADGQLFWGAGDRIAFPWERDGWTHLYSVSAEGGRAAALTPGDFEVEHVSLSRDGKDLLISSNQDDIDRRHIWRVPIQGGRPATPVLGRRPGDGMEWMPVDAGSDTVAYLRSSPKDISRAAVKAGPAEGRDLAPDSIPAEFPAAGMVKPQQVIFPAADGLPIHGQLFMPATPAQGKRPAIVFFHGGSRRQMLLGWHYMYYYSNTYAMNQYLASRGYIVLSVNYRSGIGYGLNFREAINYGASGASEYNDVIGAGLYLRNRSDVDGERIGVWGGSYGGYLTAMALARASHLFAAGVDLHGVHDWSARGGLNAIPDAERQRIAFESSPMASIKTWRSPVLLIHGDDDRNVDFSQTVRLVDALRAQKVEIEQLVFPDEVHDFLTHAHWMAAMNAADKFFAKKLKK
jgi:dipeptidyl aminopeptidase/acylaminoacyl peptidase